MRHPTLAVVVAAMALPVLAGGAPTQDDDDRDHGRAKVFRATLASENEVPPISAKRTTPPVAEARGSARLVINADETEIAYRLTYSGLQANSTQAHVHFAPSRINGGIMFFFCSNLPTPPPPPAAVPQPCPALAGTITGTITADDIVAGANPQGIAPGEFAEVVKAITSGQAYANVHSAMFGGGEIRGQLR